MVKLILPLCLMFFILSAGCPNIQSDITGEDVEYKTDNVVLKGYLAYDRSVKGKRPGVLVVHEWWGHNEYARRRSRMLAKLGYVALAVDMYGEGRQALHPSDAGKFAGEVMENMDIMKERFESAYRFLENYVNVDPKNMAAIGYCFGGSVVLEMARAGEDLKGVVSFHGGLNTKNPAEKGRVKAKILVCNGGDDNFVTGEQIEAFRKEMTDGGVDFRLINYPGARHSFTNPDADKYAEEFNLQIAYNAEADKKSWKDMKSFLKKIFGK